VSSILIVLGTKLKEASSHDKVPGFPQSLKICAKTAAESWPEHTHSTSNIFIIRNLTIFKKIRISFRKGISNII